MKILDTLSRNLGFTPNEGKIIFFLVGSFVIGVTLKLSGVTKQPEPQFDYSSIDSDFVSRSSVSQLLPDSSGQPDEDIAMDSSRQFSTSKKTEPGAIININTATKSQLTTLPGIGESTAEKILLYRGGLGKFKSISDLLNVEGIGEKKLEKLKPYLTVGK